MTEEVDDAEELTDDPEDVDTLPTGSCDGCGVDVFGGEKFCEACAFRRSPFSDNL